MEGQEKRGRRLGSPGCCPAGWPYHLRNPLIEWRSAESSSAGICKLGLASLPARHHLLPQHTTCMSLTFEKWWYNRRRRSERTQEELLHLCHSVLGEKRHYHSGLNVYNIYWGVNQIWKSTRNEKQTAALQLNSKNLNLQSLYMFATKKM